MHRSVGAHWVRLFLLQHGVERAPVAQRVAVRSARAPGTHLPVRIYRVALHAVDRGACARARFLRALERTPANLNGVGTVGARSWAGGAVPPSAEQISGAVKASLETVREPRGGDGRPALLPRSIPPLRGCWPQGVEGGHRAGGFPRRGGRGGAGCLVLQHRDHAHGARVGLGGGGDGARAWSGGARRLADPALLQPAWRALRGVALVVGDALGPASQGGGSAQPQIGVVHAHDVRRLRIVQGHQVLVRGESSLVQLEGVHCGGATRGKNVVRGGILITSHVLHTHEAPESISPNESTPPTSDAPAAQRQASIL
mmetsp:Transcript_20619/g.39190  ORF Transcript_20619/g.39190 Transcript_20619/m.39190 type:complete len:314 (+) Transcript_20619:568-1509(+)